MTSAHPVGVTDCNRNEPGLQSTEIWDYMICIYPSPEDRIPCHGDGFYPAGTAINGVGTTLDATHRHPCSQPVLMRGDTHAYPGSALGVLLSRTALDLDMGASQYALTYPIEIPELSHLPCALRVDLETRGRQSHGLVGLRGTHGQGRLCWVSHKHAAKLTAPGTPSSPTPRWLLPHTQSR